MKRRPVLAALLGGILLLGACSAPSRSKSPEDLSGTTLKVAFDVDGPPFAYVKGGSTPQGFDVDVIEEVARRTGFTVEKTALPFDGILPALQAGQVQIAAAAISITEERAKSVRFSTPYFQTGLTLAVKPSTTGIEKMEDAQGKKLAVRTGASSSLYVESLDYADKITLHRYNSTNDVLQAVISGVDDVLVNDRSILDHYVAQRGKGQITVVGPLLTKDNYGYAVPRNRPDIQEALDSAIRAMAEDGTYTKIYEKYFGKTPDVLPGNIR
ncbi:substrate-binding periplasmic protein [Streptomyces sp. NPDC052042]|uniref:substrate-binding periplasmic protein n=1 Tax=Streptomyces sp. NPDC052042 TaxID=3365683 RepID=UPI0037CDDFB9